MSEVALGIEADEEIGAIVPRMLDAGRPVAPVFIRFWGVSYVPSGFEGISRREIHATNSATLFRVSALKQIGGFSPYFWLDYVDGYVFRQFHMHGLKVYVARDIDVEHELSLLHGGELKADRYRNILRAESAFWDMYGGYIQGLALTGRLLGRMWRQWKRGHELSVRQLTWQELKRRILQSKTHRINDWMREMELRIQGYEGTEKGQGVSEERPAISVCMAAYNGEKYIAAQLQSILSQLGAEDEVIVVDDGSTDGTREQVRSLKDGRIRLLDHDRNLGVSHTFEDAIRAASGDILFLSDQDDLWAADRVSAVLRAFQLFPDVDIVASDAVLIDENDAPIGSSYYAQRGKFRSGVLANIVRCSYLGCTMVFRGRICARILPFPTGADVLHDLWIGASNALAGGKTVYIDRPLVRYRRHADNFTGNRRLTTGRQIRIRWALCRSLAQYWLDSRRAYRK
jgi:GT2 family glycosyltransferase